MKRADNQAVQLTQEASFQLAIVTVTYNPDLRILGAQLIALPQPFLKIIVDNKSTPDVRAALTQLAASLPRTVIIENEANLGLPAAINQGVRYALNASPDCRYVLWLDQDTEPPQGGVEKLLSRYEQLRSQGLNPGSVGPRLVDAATGLEHGFHRMQGWRWTRCYPAPADDPVECHNLNCSGTLVSCEVFAQLGGLEEDLFLDHLDTEWAFRVQAAGYKLFGIPSVTFVHRMGQSSWRVWAGGWKIWPYRSPQRHFFLFRNAIRLMRRDYVPRVWKFWAIVKLFLTAFVHTTKDPRRVEQLRFMARGVVAGLQRGGKVDNSSSRLL